MPVLCGLLFPLTMRWAAFAPVHADLFHSPFTAAWYSRQWLRGRFFNSHAQLVDRRAPSRRETPVPASSCTCATLSAGWVLGGGIPGRAH